MQARPYHYRCVGAWHRCAAGLIGHQLRFACVCPYLTFLRSTEKVVETVKTTSIVSAVQVALAARV